MLYLLAADEIRSKNILFDCTTSVPGETREYLDEPLMSLSSQNAMILI